MSPRFRTSAAVVLTLLLLFFGVALFSALHQHTSGVCSLGNLEHQIVSLAEAAVALIPSTTQLPAEILQTAELPVVGHTLSARDRAPPSLS